jgi:uncharacterized protein (TIGR00369 family)
MSGAGGPSRTAKNAMTAAQFQALIDEHLPIAHWLGFTVTAMGEGKVTVEMPFRPAFVRPGGTVAGPMMMALADCAMYGAVLAGDSAAIMAVTSNLSIHFLRGAKPAALIAEAALMRMGRRLAVVAVTLRSKGEPKPVAHVMGTYALPDRETQEGIAVP